MSVTPLRAAEAEWARFDDFWTAYPRRVARKDAEKSWARLTDSDRNAAMLALVKWRKVWAKKELEFVPHASTWLNGARWEDELPVDAVSTYAAHAPAKIVDGVRGEMPEEVRAMLAKLRK